MEKMQRRSFLKAAGALATASMAATGELLAAPETPTPQQKPLKPKRLQRGDTIGIVAPSGITWDDFALQLAIESLEAMGLKAKVFPNAMERYGYLAGTDENRAADLMAAFVDPDVDAIFCLRGGWGAARILTHLDYAAIEANPKILMGYSDITALHAAIAAQTRLVTYHGPNAGSSWRLYEADIVKSLLFQGKQVEYQTLVKNDGTLVPRINRPRTLVGGRAKGKLVGGNLTVFTSIMGSPYFPDLTGKILCLEDIGEKIYRVDRMITQLALGGHLKGLKGVVLGGFTDCGPDENEPYGGFLLGEVFKQHFGGLGIPVFWGAQFGHIKDNSALPLGVMVEMNADECSLKLLESAVA